MFWEKSRFFRVGQWGDFSKYNNFRVRFLAPTAFLGLRQLFVFIFSASLTYQFIAFNSFNINNYTNCIKQAEL